MRIMLLASPKSKRDILKAIEQSTYLLNSSPLTSFKWKGKSMFAKYNPVKIW
jgi:hypothetical protein